MALGYKELLVGVSGRGSYKGNAIFLVCTPFCLWLKMGLFRENPSAKV